jgi:hypothetical protein
MRVLLKLALLVVVMALMFGAGFVVSLGVGEAVDPTSLSERERSFTERMRDVVLVGHFTMEGRENSGGNPERYEIESVTKVSDNKWQFKTRLTYGNVDATLPLTMPLLWAGDTPIVSITDFSIPTLGTFTSRVMFYDDRYAGSWQHGEYGGLMYGTITKR